jgi:hypothetical protein
LLLSRKLRLDPLHRPDADIKRRSDLAAGCGRVERRLDQPGMSSAMASRLVAPLPADDRLGYARRFTGRPGRMIARSSA